MSPSTSAIARTSTSVVTPSAARPPPNSHTPSNLPLPLRSVYGSVFCHSRSLFSSVYVSKFCGVQMRFATPTFSWPSPADAQLGPPGQTMSGSSKPSSRASGGTLLPPSPQAASASPSTTTGTHLLIIITGGVVSRTSHRRGSQKSAMAEPRDVLREVFGHAEFRFGQPEAAEAVLSGRDAVVLLPTGAGKSVCYQVPAIA